MHKILVALAIILAFNTSFAFDVFVTDCHDEAFEFAGEVLETEKGLSADTLDYRTDDINEVAGTDNQTLFELSYRNKDNNDKWTDWSPIAVTVEVNVDPETEEVSCTLVDTNL